jgi:hypothetical protein
VATHISNRSSTPALLNRGGAPLSHPPIGSNLTEERFPSTLTSKPKPYSTFPLFAIPKRIMTDRLVDWTNGSYLNRRLMSSQDRGGEKRLGCRRRWRANWRLAIGTGGSGRVFVTSRPWFFFKGTPLVFASLLSCSAGSKSTGRFPFLERGKERTHGNGKGPRTEKDPEIGPYLQYQFWAG